MLPGIGNNDSPDFGLLIETMNAAVSLLEVVCDERGAPADYRFVYVNRAYPDLTGLCAGSIIGRTVREVLPRICKETLDMYDRVATTGVPEDIQGYDEAIGIHCDVSVYRPAPGSLAVVALDRTEQARAREEDRQRYDLLNLILGYSSECCILTDADAVIGYASPSILALLGHSAEDVTGRRLYEFVHPGHSDEVRRGFLDLANGGSAFPFRFPTIHSDGSWREIEGNVRNHMGTESIRGMLVCMRDVTEHSATARSLSEARVDIARKESTLRTTTSVGRAIAAYSEIGEFLKEFLHSVVAQLRIDAADILVDDGAESFVCRESLGFRHAAPVSGRSLDKSGPAILPAWTDRNIHYHDSAKGEWPGALDPDLMAAEGFASYIAIPLVSHNQTRGILELYHRNRISIDSDWWDALVALASQAAVAIENSILFSSLVKANQNITTAYDATLEGWSKAMDLRDRETEGHSKRVADATVFLYKGLGLDPEQLIHVRRGALLHDVGKLAIPDEILLKPGPLTESEWELMRRHPIYAYEWLSTIPYLIPALDIPLHHHERWNGTGYPSGLKGDAIPLTARIFAVVDVWDALTSQRPYRVAWSREKALDYIRGMSGIHFDPEIVSCFIWGF